MSFYFDMRRMWSEGIYEGPHSPGSIGGGGGGGNDRMNSPSIGRGGKLYDSKTVSK